MLFPGMIGLPIYYAQVQMMDHLRFGTLDISVEMQLQLLLGIKNK
jgi:hypothetical protein